MKRESNQTFFKNSFPEHSQLKIKKSLKKNKKRYCLKMLKDCAIKIVYRQMFYSEWICFLNKGQKCSGILKFLSSHILICQVCNNQNDTQTMGSLQKVIPFSLVWMVLANPFCFKKIYEKSRS